MIANIEFAEFRGSRRREERGERRERGRERKVGEIMRESHLFTWKEAGDGDGEGRGGEGRGDGDDHCRRITLLGYSKLLGIEYFTEFLSK